MFRRGLVLCVVLGVASVANAGAVLDIVAEPSANPALPAGVYDEGEMVNFAVGISQDTGSVIQARLLSIAFQNTDIDLTLVGDAFAWDFSTLASNALYSQFLDYPVPNVTYTSTSPVAGFILEIPADATLLLGGGTVMMPSGPGALGNTYFLDALNPGEANPNLTARLDFDFDNPTTWTGFSGDITGGRVGLTVIPEPATLALLALGGVAALRRRRA